MNSEQNIVRLKLPGRLPSWNEVLNMHYRERHQLKRKIQNEFLCVLRLYGTAFSTRTTSAKNTWSIAADTLASYLLTHQTKQKSKSPKGSARQAKQNMS
jgi:hypothetical protein